MKLDPRTLFRTVAVVAVPPFGTLIFGIWADRHGLLRTAESSRDGDRAVPVAS